MSQALSIEAFNGIWWGLIAALVVFNLLIWLLFRHRSEKTRRRLIIGICVCNFIFFWVYKFWLSQDSEYLTNSSYQGFNIWLELPLQLCNINIWLIPFALLIKREGYLAFCFYTATVGAFMALVSPVTSFEGSLLLLRNIGYYGTHFLVITSGICLSSLGFIKVRQRDVLWTLIFMIALVCAIHGINTLLHSLLGVNANYIYTYGPEGSVLLGKAWAMFPVPLAYLFIFAFAVVPALMLLTALINLPTWLKQRHKKTIEAPGRFQRRRR